MGKEQPTEHATVAHILSDCVPRPAPGASREGRKEPPPAEASRAKYHSGVSREGGKQFFFVDFVDPSFEQAECRRGNRERRSVVTGSGSIHDRYVLLIPTPQTADRRSPGEKTAAYLLQCLRTTVGFIELTATCNVGPRGGVPITRRGITYPRPTRRGVRSI